MKCNVYEVEITISQVGGYHSGKENKEYTKKSNVLAISNEAAEKKVERALKWELRDLLENSGGYCTKRSSKLLLEDVTY